MIRDDERTRAIFDRYSDAVMGYCVLSTGGDRDRAKDLLQETFIRAFANVDRLRDETKLEAWIMTITRNVCRTKGAREQRERTILAELSMEADVPSEAEEREARIATVRRELEALPAGKLKDIAKMYYTDPPHTTRQIAEALGIPHGTVTVKLMRFRSAFKRRLVEALIGEEGVTT